MKVIANISFESAELHLRGHVISSSQWSSLVTFEYLLKLPHMGPSPPPSVIGPSTCKQIKYIRFLLPPPPPSPHQEINPHLPRIEMNSIFNNFLKLIKASKFKKYFDKPRPPPKKKSSRLEALLKPITKLYNIR